MLIGMRRSIRSSSSILPRPSIRALALIAAVWPVSAFAEPQSVEAARVLADETVTKINQTFDCRIGLLGSPRRDSFLSGWVIAFAAAGRDCDAAQAALASDGADAGVQFMRRPNLSQLRALLGPMIRSAELASGCRIALRGQPVLDEKTTRWFVHVIGFGGSCGEAIRHLSEQAADIDTTILGSTDRPLLDRTR